MTGHMARIVQTTLLFLLAAATPAAATGNFCSVSGATSVSIGNYNAFSGTGITQVPMTLDLTRYVGGGGRKTQKADFYISMPAGSPSGYDIRYQGSSVLYVYPQSHLLSFPGPSGTVYYDFGGAGQPDTVAIPLVVTIPPNLDLAAGSEIKFDLVYICTGTGGLLDVSLPTRLNNAITLQLNILSALQASYIGSTLDFGEIGSLSDTDALQRTITGAIRVASTGPYSVALSSANGYKMRYPGANPDSASQNIRYSARMLGQTVDSFSPIFTTTACARAGTAGQNLSLSVTLREGGRAKLAAPNYSDNLIITVTPIAVPFAGASQNCQNL